MKLTAFLFLLPVMLNSCSNTENRKEKGDLSKLPYHIDLTRSPARDLFLSEFAEEVSYVRLKKEGIFVGGYCKVKAGKDCFIIDDHDQELLAFDRSGKFMNKIGMIGKGPKEYPYVPVEYQVDNENNEVYTQIDRRAVSVYSIQGQFLRNFKLPEFRPKGLIMAGSRLFVAPLAPPTDRYIPLEVFKTDGTKVKEYSFVYTRTDRPPISSPHSELSLTHDNEVIVETWCHDTTFIATPQGEWKPYIVYNRGTGKMPETETFYEAFWGDYPDNYCTIYLKDLGKYLAMATIHGKESYFCFFSKQTGELFRLNNYEPETGPQYFNFQNDLDGGPGLLYHHSISGHYLYCVHQAIDLIQWKKSGYFDRVEPKFPEKKQKLFAMIDSLKPEDNPVIMIVKIKE